MTQLFSDTQQALRGRKTYLIMALMVLNGLYGLVFGGEPTFDNPIAVSQTDAVTQILQGLGFGTVRAGISKVGGG